MTSFIHISKKNSNAECGSLKLMSNVWHDINFTQVKCIANYMCAHI